MSGISLMTRSLILAAIIAAMAWPAVARDVKPRVAVIYACVNAANDRRTAEQDLLPSPGEDRRTPQYLNWNAGMTRVEATFRADVRRCMTAMEAANFCMFGELISNFDDGIDQCGLRQALPQGRPAIGKGAVDATGVLNEAAYRYDQSQTSPCNQGGDEGTGYIKAHGITAMSDKRLCKALITWFGPTGTRVTGLLTVAK